MNPMNWIRNANKWVFASKVAAFGAAYYGLADYPWCAWAAFVAYCVIVNAVWEPTGPYFAVRMVVPDNDLRGGSDG